MAGNLFDVKEWSFSPKGIMLALFSSLTYAVYGRVSKGVRWQAKSMSIMIGSSLSIFIINSQTILINNHFGRDFMLWAIFFAIVGTTIPTALFAAGISKIGAGISSILMTIELPVAVICAYVVLNEYISPLQIAGIIIMLAAITSMNYYKYLKTKNKNKSCSI